MEIVYNNFNKSQSCAEASIIYLLVLIPLRLSRIQMKYIKTTFVICYTLPKLDFPWSKKLNCQNIKANKINFDSDWEKKIIKN